MKTKKVINFFLTFDEVKTSLKAYQRDMIFEMIHEGMTKGEVADFAIRLLEDVDVEAEKVGIHWISTPRCSAEWADAIESNPAVFFSDSDLATIMAAVGDPNTTAKVQIENGVLINVENLLANY